MLYVCVVVVGTRATQLNKSLIFIRLLLVLVHFETPCRLDVKISNNYVLSGPGLVGVTGCQIYMFITGHGSLLVLVILAQSSMS